MQRRWTGQFLHLLTTSPPFPITLASSDDFPMNFVPFRTLF
jgi:hypothetical protein